MCGLYSEVDEMYKTKDHCSITLATMSEKLAYLQLSNLLFDQEKCPEAIPPDLVLYSNVQEMKGRDYFLRIKCLSTTSRESLMSY